MACSGLDGRSSVTVSAAGRAAQTDRAAGPCDGSGLREHLGSVECPATLPRRQTSLFLLSCCLSPCPEPSQGCKTSLSYKECRPPAGLASPECAASLMHQDRKEGSTNKHNKRGGGGMAR